MNGREFDYLGNEWANISTVILLGLGNVAKGCIDKIKDDFSIEYIIDSYSTVTSFRGISGYDFETGMKKRHHHKIIVMNGGRMYLENSALLSKVGLKEYIDYCSVELFITEWYWKCQKKNCLMEVHTAI